MRGRRVSLADLSEQDVLQLRLKDLPVSLSSVPMALHMLRVQGELNRKGLRLFPNFWISTEWFVAEGGTGVAIPFYLLHPRLLEMEKRYTGEAEGEGEEALKLLRHELGHVVDHAFKLRSLSERRALFGLSSQPYLASYEPQKYSRSFVQHLSGNYAQSHPDEDFAETFAIWLTPGSHWRKKYKNWPAFKKLCFVDRLMRELSGRTPPVRNREKVDSIEHSDLTLEQYYRKKNRYLRKEGHFRKLDVQLLEVFSRESLQQPMAADRYLRNHRRDVVREVASRMRMPQYKIGRVVQEMINRCRQLNLQVVTSQRQTNLRLKAVLYRESQHFEKSGLYREKR